LNANIEMLSEFSIKCFTKLGMPEKDAKTVTETMVTADLRGIHSHGFIRLPIYVKRIQKGFIKADTEITVENETDTMALLNGNFSAGQVIGKKTMETAIEKAKKAGIGLAVAKNSNHFGIAAHYATMAAEQNMIGIVMSNVEPLMPAIGGAEKIIGNNPIAIAAPSKNEQNPIVLDMALSNAPLGKILVAQSKGDSIPDGWGVDKEGRPTNDPSDVLDGGFLYPVGGPKGFGLAIIAEILTGVLAGSQFSKDIPSMYDLQEKQSISHFMLAIDVSVFGAPEEFNDRMSILSSFVKNTRKASGVTETYLPGEIEFSRENNNRNIGIPIEENVLNDLKAVADELEIEFPISLIQTT